MNLLVRSILEYGVVVWHPHFTRDTLRIARVQNRFLSDVAFLLKIDRPQHDYSLIRSTLQLPSLASRRIDAFIKSLLNGSLDSPDLLYSISILPLTMQEITPYFKFPIIILCMDQITPYIECNSTISALKTFF